MILKAKQMKWSWVLIMGAVVVIAGLAAWMIGNRHPVTAPTASGHRPVDGSAGLQAPPDPVKPAPQAGVCPHTDVSLVFRPSP
jgi:hypothetical protein